LALEVATHSPWVSRYLADLGHEVIVANPRRVRLITDSTRKDDRLDAKTLGLPPNFQLKWNRASTNKYLQGGPVKTTAQR
jgi:crotonobetainyl-CoA:carnitine CoA-transferase CaiB-like acyl-CoA transferase